MKRRRDILIQYAVLITALLQFGSNYYFLPGFQEGSLPMNQTEILFIPAQFAFLIWIPIILLSSIYSIYQVLPQFSYNKIARKTAPYFIALFLGFFVWLAFASQVGIYFSPNFKPNALFGTVVTIITMLGITSKLYTLIDNYNVKWNILDVLRSTSVPLYFGWLLIATSANITTYLHTLSFDFLLSDEVWASSLVLLNAIVAAIILTKSKTLIHYVLFGLTIMWGIFGLIISNAAKSDLVVGTSWLAIIIVVIIVVTKVTKKILKDREVTVNI